MRDRRVTRRYAHSVAVLEFRTTKSSPSSVTTAPAQAALVGVVGDALDVKVHLVDSVTAAPINCAGWTWTARAAGGTLVIDFGTVAQPDGVILHLSGAATATIPPGVLLAYDVASFQTGEPDGRVVLAGTLRTDPRVTDPHP